jgi:hypothetical protein
MFRRVHGIARSPTHDSPSPHMTCTQCKFGFCFGCLQARGSYVQPGEHVQCAQLSATFEQNANRMLADLRNAEKTLARRRAREAMRARQESRATRSMALRLAPMPDVEVRADFFELDFAAPPAAVSATAPVVVVEQSAMTADVTRASATASEPRARQSLLAGAVTHARVPRTRRALAMSS